MGDIFTEPLPGDRIIDHSQLLLYLARCLALPENQPRHDVAGQMPTFLQTLFSLAAGRPATSVIFALPSEQDANRRVAAALKSYLPRLLKSVGEMERTSNRQAQNLTPTQSFERAAVISRRLFDRVDRSATSIIADTCREYFEQQRAAGVEIEQRAFDPSYSEQIEKSYLLHSRADHVVRRAPGRYTGVSGHARCPAPCCPDHSLRLGK